MPTRLLTRVDAEIEGGHGAEGGGGGGAETAGGGPQASMEPYETAGHLHLQVRNSRGYARPDMRQGPSQSSCTPTPLRTRDRKNPRIGRRSWPLRSFMLDPFVSTSYARKALKSARARSHTENFKSRGKSKPFCGGKGGWQFRMAWQSRCGWSKWML
eukprot:749224-Hanusia_phi.AAC.2